MSETPPLLSKPRGFVAMVELNRPSAANRIELDDLTVLGRHLAACERDKDVHVLVLTARGKHFSAGFDLRALSASSAAGQETRPDQGVSAFEELTERLDKTRLIVIAAINGPVVGGATDIALACDLRIGVRERASMSMPAARIGLPLYAGALQRYVTRLGLNQAKRLVFLGKKIDAEEMLEIGFLFELVAGDALLERALDLASEIAAMPPEPLAVMKQALNAAALGRGAELRDHLTAAFDGPRTARLIKASVSARRSSGSGD